MAGGIQLTWEIEGERQLSRILRAKGDSVKDWTPAFKTASEELKDLFSGEVFDSEGRAIQETWSPLSRAYAARKAQKYPGRGVLEATGRMRRSFNNLYQRDRAVIWNAMEYFKYHQSRQPRSRLPRRVMMKLGHQQRELVVKVFHTHLRKKMA